MPPVLAAIINGVGNLLMRIAREIAKIAGAAVESIKVFFRHFF